MFLVSIKDLRDSPKTTIKGLLIGAIPIFLLTIFRFLYFGSMLPNTFHAKAGGISMALFIRGFQYGISAMIGFLPLFLLGTWGMIRKRKEKYSQLAMVMSLLFLLGLVVVGGDTFPLYRFALPIIPILSIFAAPQLLQIKSDSKIRHLIVTVFLLILLGWTINPMNPFSKISEMDQFLLARKQAATWELV
jgi:4-amino-4-deoxy-L-arabinose transferase-like glycosyltransferase